MFVNKEEECEAILHMFNAQNFLHLKTKLQERLTTLTKLTVAQTWDTVGIKPPLQRGGSPRCRHH
jgi:hypothetical protein